MVLRYPAGKSGRRRRDPWRTAFFGVLALANPDEGKSFTKADFELVQSVADDLVF